MSNRSLIYIFLLTFLTSTNLFSEFDIPERTIPNTTLYKPSTHRNISVQELGTAYTPQDLVDNILGEGISISNIEYTGTTTSAGLFQNGSTSGLGIDEGVILSSGFVTGIPGPNSSSGFSGTLGLPGDSDLNSLIPGYNTYDATILEFDFVPDLNAITFSYVFASEEYLEYVNSSYNDVFGFFLNGVNVAVIPNSTTPVSINNVNHLVNTNYFINNDVHSYSYPPPVIYDIEADGFTTRLTVHAFVNQGQQNHIKFAIADAGDTVLDSWVFLEAESFASVQLTPLQVIVDQGVLHETDEDIPVDIEVSAIGLNNANFIWLLSNPIWGNAQFIFDRYAQEDRTIRYSPDPDYNGYDSFVVSVYDNLGHSVQTVIGILVVHQNDPPQNTLPPSISGNFVVGEQVHCDAGEWNDDADNQHVPPWEPPSIITIYYQWQRSVEGRSWEDIDQAVEADYIIQSQDAEHFIRCMVTAEDNGTGMGDNNSTSLASNEEYCQPLIDANENLITLPTSIMAVRPNPFNPSTKIDFNLSVSGKVLIKIVNLKGETVKILENGTLTKGLHVTEWNGLDNLGKVCSSGIYFVILKTPDQVDSNKLILLK